MYGGCIQLQITAGGEAIFVSATPTQVLHPAAVCLGVLQCMAVRCSVSHCVEACSPLVRRSFFVRHVCATCYTHEAIMSHV